MWALIGPIGRPILHSACASSRGKKKKARQAAVQESLRASTQFESAVPLRSATVALLVPWPPRLYVRLMHELHDGRPELHTATHSSGYRNKASFSLGKQFVGEQDGAQNACAQLLLVTESEGKLRRRAERAGGEAAGACDLRIEGRHSVHEVLEILRSSRRRNPTPSSSWRRP